MMSTLSPAKATSMGLHLLSFFRPSEPLGSPLSSLADEDKMGNVALSS